MSIFPRHSFDNDLFFDAPFPRPLHHASPFGYGVATFNSNDLEVISDNEDAFEAEIRVDGFRPEDIKIDLRSDDRVLTVNAKYEEKSERGTLMKQFSRTFNLPPECKLDEIQSVFKRNGQLRLYAPKMRKANHKTVMQHPYNANDGQIFNNYNSGADRVLDTDDSFSVEVNVEGFEPDDLIVDVDDVSGTLTVTARHEEKAKGNFVSRHFRRQYQLPQDCKKEAVQSVLSRQGVLRIEAPKEKRSKALEDGQVKKVHIEVKK